MSPGLQFPSLLAGGTYYLYLQVYVFAFRQCSGYSKDKQTHFGFQSVQEDVKKEKVDTQS